jgi:hypothetical protein
VYEGQESTKGKCRDRGQKEGHSAERKWVNGRETETGKRGEVMKVVWMVTNLSEKAAVH